MNLRGGCGIEGRFGLKRELVRSIPVGLVGLFLKQYFLSEDG